MKQNLFSPFSRILLLGLASVAIVGCADMKTPGYYEPPRESTATDAMRQARGSTSGRTLQAPSQMQIQTSRMSPKAQANQAEKMSTQKADEQAYSLLLTQLLPKVQTYHGTLPCFHQEMRCTNQQLTLTLAPNGQWRARAQYVNPRVNQGESAQKGYVTQGCWRLVPMNPANLVLLDTKGNARAEMLFLNRNNLQVNLIDGEPTNLVYTLNRQPDLDPIQELDGTAPLQCQ